jgi:hypothetical protein
MAQRSTRRAFHRPGRTRRGPAVRAIPLGAIPRLAGSDVEGPVPTFVADDPTAILAPLRLVSQPVKLIAVALLLTPEPAHVVTQMITLEGSLGLAIRATFHNLLAHGHDAV